MNFEFVCEVEIREPSDEPHRTTGVMQICPTCRRSAVAGYWCDTCGHEDVDPPGQISGHGEGVCNRPDGAKT